MKKLVVLSQFLLFALSSILGQPTFCVDLQKNSSITINGTTNILPFKLTQSGEKLSRRSFIINATQSQNKILISQNEHTILVKDFSSTNKMALRDFLKLVKADSHPTFYIKLNYFEIDPKITNTDLSKANASIDLTITGKTRKYNVPITSTHEGDLYVLKGTEKLNIRDFGLVPPIEMMGLIRVNEWISIDFNIVCRIDAYKASPELNATNVVR